MERKVVIGKMFEQQEYMYKYTVHIVKDKIVSIAQPFVRPIVRSKRKAPIELGAKFDLSIENGLVKLENIIRCIL